MEGEKGKGSLAQALLPPARWGKNSRLPPGAGEKIPPSLPLPRQRRAFDGLYSSSPLLPPAASAARNFLFEQQKFKDDGGWASGRADWFKVGGGWFRVGGDAGRRLQAMLRPRAPDTDSFSHFHFI